jgi:NAD(P)-dependent dehydrogenase (short-subunit alcohol dehydrogenase family)
MSKTALITGAAGGIGKATVEKFVSAGWQVIACDRNDSEVYPEGASFEHVDVSQPKEIEGMFVRLASQIGELHGLVNNAAIQITKPMIEMTVDEWDETMATNLRSIFLTARYGHDLLKAGQGAIINISSVHALATSRDIAAYAASKGGISALTRAMAIEFASDNIRVNAVVPGAVETPMLRNGLLRGHVNDGTLDEKISELGQRTALGRVGQPEEIAELILFLADRDRSSFMTGQAITIDGGATARLSTE